jgi:hypothetical protein
MVCEMRWGMLVTEVDGPSTTPVCWFCHILYTFPHICIVANNLRGVDLGGGIVVVTKPSRSPVAFVLEVFTKTQYVELYYVEDTYVVSRRCVDFYFAGRVVEYVTHCHEPPRTRAHAALVSCMWPLSQPALTLDSPHLACPLALATPPHPNSDRGTSERTRRTTRVRLSTQSVQYCHLLFTNATWLARACAC